MSDGELPTWSGRLEDWLKRPIVVVVVLVVVVVVLVLVLVLV